MRPVYIVCSQGGAEDKATNLVSMFGVIESLTFERTLAPADSKDDRAPIIRHAVPFRTTAVWMLEDSDDIGNGLEYEGELAFIDTEGKRVIFAKAGLRTESDARLLRLTLDVPFPLRMAEKPGLIHVEAGMRAAGSTEWITQRYPIRIEVKERESA